MKISFAGDRVLAVVAHPDDAELLCAGTLARARADGASIGICVLCRGDRGQPKRRIRNLAGLRAKEMKASARLLQAALFRGGFPDGGLQDSPAVRRKLLEIFRQFKPTLVLAHAGEDYHPDHRAASALTEAVSWFCTSRGHRTPSPAFDFAPALWWIDTVNMSGFDPGFFIDISDFLELKVRLLDCHQSQLQRADDRDFSPLEEMLRLQARVRGMQAGVAAAEAFRVYHGFKRGRAL